jgi:hypothetical protein
MDHRRESKVWVTGAIVWQPVEALLHGPGGARSGSAPGSAMSEYLSTVTNTGDSSCKAL